MLRRTFYFVFLILIVTLLLGCALGIPVALRTTVSGAVGTIVAQTSAAALTQTAAVAAFIPDTHSTLTDTPFPPITNTTVPTATQTATATLTSMPTSSATSTFTYTPVLPTYTSLPTATSTTTPSATVTPTRTSSPPTSTRTPTQTPKSSISTPTSTRTKTPKTQTAYWEPWSEGTVVSLSGSGQGIGTTKYFTVLDGAKATVIRPNGLKLLGIPNKAAGGSKMVAYGETVTLLGYWNYNPGYNWYFVKIITSDGKLYWVGGDAKVDRNSWVQSCNPINPDPHCSLKFIPYVP
jgi:hypothetical protein